MGELGTIGMAGVAALTTALSILYADFWIRGSRFLFLIEPLPYRKHPFKDLYLFGFELLERIRYRYTNVYDRRMSRHIQTLFGKQHAEYYRRINMAQKCAVAVPVLVFFLILSMAVNDWSVVLFAFAASAAAAYYFDRVIYEAITKRQESIRRDFPEVLTELTLLVNAGMVLPDAWRKVSEGGEGILYREMLRASDRAENGVPIYDAYLEFAERCGDRNVDKIIPAMLQNITKGNRELCSFLQRTSQDSWNERKQAIRRKGEEASTKMLLPIGLMFIGILVMILLPMMRNMTY